MKQKPQEYQAFVDLVYEHQGILQRICSVYTSSPEDREDLRQEILLQSWRSFASFNGRSKFSTWLYRVALNTALVRRRKAAARREVACEPGANVDVAIDDSGARDPDVELLYRCIQELPELNRAIVLLHLEQHSYEEIAEITGLSRSNVSVRLVRIREKLRELLLARGYREGQTP
jgi:RNA polymerase sigma-70 factor (ECF subfamily)